MAQTTYFRKELTIRARTIGDVIYRNAPTKKNRIMGVNKQFQATYREFSYACVAPSGKYR